MVPEFLFAQYPSITIYSNCRLRIDSCESTGCGDNRQKLSELSRKTKSCFLSLKGGLELNCKVGNANTDVLAI